MTRFVHTLTGDGAVNLEHVRSAHCKIHDDGSWDVVVTMDNDNEYTLANRATREEARRLLTLICLDPGAGDAEDSVALTK
jgi:hypothetical protein